MMGGIVAYIDGFNLYHAIDALGNDSLKWLDLRELCKTLVARSRSQSLRGYNISDVKYFTALATWNSEALCRHQTYIRALIAHDVTPIMGNFRVSTIRCRECGREWEKPEEKRTDVNIAVHIVSDAIRKAYDRAILISADADIVPAVELAKKERGKNYIAVFAPPRRRRTARSLNPIYEIPRTMIQSCRLPEQIPTSKRPIVCPNKYRLG